MGDWSLKSMWRAYKRICGFAYATKEVKNRGSTIKEVTY
jgi:hypothetical protein